MRQSPSRVLALVIALASALNMSAVQAQAVPPANPPPQPVPGYVSGPMLFGPMGNYPYDYHFQDQLNGQAFRPGEQVTITAVNLSLAPVSVTADAGGNFQLTVSYTWVFCGANHAAQPAPIFHATGNEGSSAQLAKPPVQCPELVVLNRPLAADGSPPGGGPINPVGTGSAGPATVVTLPPNAGPPATVPPGSGPVGSPPLTPPSGQAALTPFQIEGFGFAPGETVSVQQVQTPQLPATVQPAMQATADSMGRFRVTTQGYLPPLCSQPVSYPRFTAQGNQGTTATVQVETLPVLMIACPVTPLTPVPPGTAPGTPVPPGIPPVGPAPAPVPAGGGSDVNATATPAPTTILDSPVPVLSLVTVAHYQLAVAGRDWGPSTRVNFRIHAGPRQPHIALRTTAAGTFLVGVKNLDICSHPQFEAKDGAGHDVKLNGPQLMCPEKAHPARPSLKVLQGRLLCSR